MSCLIVFILITFNASYGEYDGQLELGYDDLRIAVKKGLGYDAPDWRVTRYRQEMYDLLKRCGVIESSDPYGNLVILFPKDGRYYRLNCPHGLRYINEILQSHVFGEADYANQDKIWQLATYIMTMYSSEDVLLVSNNFPWNLEHISDYLNEPNQIFIEPNKLEINEQILKRILCDPTFANEGNCWKIHFNTLTLRGGMQSWLILGKGNKENTFLQINKVAIEDIEPEGTFKDPFDSIYYTDRTGPKTKKQWSFSANNSSVQEDFLAVLEECLQRKIEFMYITEKAFDWLQNETVVSALDYRYRFMLSYLYKDGRYLQLNCKEGIPYINMLLREYHFGREEFKNPEKVSGFLRDLVQLYTSRYYVCAFPKLLKDLEKEEGDLFAGILWKQGGNKSMAEYISLLKEPVFVFINNKWEVEFNVFNDKRGMDKWVVSGVYDPDRKVNQIMRIMLNKIYDDNTFNLPYVSSGIWGEQYSW